MSKYELEFSEADDDGRSTLTIKHDGVEIASHCDGMEAEDRYFYRDLSWVSTELERAYQLGLTDGAAPQAANTADGHTNSEAAVSEAA